MAKKLPKRMFKNTDMVSAYRLNRSPMKLMKQVSRDHEDVLESIESLLVNRHRNNDQIDDHVVDVALAGSLVNVPPDDPLALEIYEGLAKVRTTKSDVSDNVWQDALKVVRDSVHRHSARKPREKGYLLFAGQFVP